MGLLNLSLVANLFNRL